MVLCFGKWKGQPMQEIARLDPQYLRWLVSVPFFAAHYPEQYRTARTLLMRQLEAEIENERFRLEATRLGCGDLV